jgi:hypothetical protein
MEDLNDKTMAHFLSVTKLPLVVRVHSTIRRKTDFFTLPPDIALPEPRPVATLRLFNFFGARMLGRLFIIAVRLCHYPLSIVRKLFVRLGVKAQAGNR